MRFFTSAATGTSSATLFDIQKQFLSSNTWHPFSLFRVKNEDSVPRTIITAVHLRVALRANCCPLLYDHCQTHQKKERGAKRHDRIIVRQFGKGLHEWSCLSPCTTFLIHDRSGSPSHKRSDEGKNRYPNLICQIASVTIENCRPWPRQSASEHDSIVIEWTFLWFEGV